MSTETVPPAVVDAGSLVYREAMQATILGCGEAFDATLPNTSVLITGTTTVLLDCGFSAPAQVWKFAAGPNAIDAIYLSHAHADHYFGMPAILGRMWEEGREKPLTILSQPNVLDQLHRLLELAYKGLAARFRYPIQYLEAHPGAPLELAGLRLDFAETTHAVPNLAIRIQGEARTIFYSGDGMFTDASRHLCAGADLAIHEAYKFEQSPGHADIPSLIEMTESEGIGHLAMVHVQRELRQHNRQRILEAITHAPGRFSLPEPGTSLG